MTESYSGGQAKYVRLPMADVGPMVVPARISDEEVLFPSDIFPTGYQEAEHAGIKGGEIVAIWGAGPVGLFAMQSAKGSRLIAIETAPEPERIALAKRAGVTDIIDFEKEDVFERIREIGKARTLTPSSTVWAWRQAGHSRRVMSRRRHAAPTRRRRDGRP